MSYAADTGSFDGNAKPAGHWDRSSGVGAMAGAGAINAGAGALAGAGAIEAGAGARVAGLDHTGGESGRGGKLLRLNGSIFSGGLSPTWSETW